ncbi:hypothetical protein EVAR_39637_1 [Eumeta japonica]|uniref:Uncharacterized protein n=1 Tax=Eumeta variegata TaxID=151549 RepID=A0A4C1WI72_EUMVA|nr:hypothetical protein EVAR_39637_1 [Eumeta japonica]
MVVPMHLVDATIVYCPGSRPDASCGDDATPTSLHMSHRQLTKTETAERNQQMSRKTKKCGRSVLECADENNCNAG